MQCSLSALHPTKDGLNCESETFHVYTDIPADVERLGDVVKQMPRMQLGTAYQCNGISESKHMTSLLRQPAVKQDAWREGNCSGTFEGMP